MERVSGLWRLGTVAAVGVAGIAVVVALNNGGPATTPGVAGPVVTRGSISLAGYDSCDAALQNLREAARPYVGPYGFGGEYAIADSGGAEVAPVPAPRVPQGSAATPNSGEGSGDAKAAAPEHSTTNVHEAGVDEPDLVKTDGARVVSVVDGTLRVVDAATHKLTGSAKLPQGNATGLLLDGNRVLVVLGAYLGDGGIAKPAPGPDGGYVGPYGGAASLVLADISDGVRVLGSLDIDGSYVDARQTGHVARVVLRSAPTLKFDTPDGTAKPNAMRENNLRILDESTIDDWLPRYELTSGSKTTSGRLVDCDDISHPADFSGTSMLTVLTFDLTAELGTGDPVSIVADGDTVYGTGKNLYVADDHHLRPMPYGERFAPQAEKTVIYQFDTSGPGKPPYVASGTVSGSMLNQYSLGEFDGTLRVATTTGTDNAVSVLRRDGDQLVQLGRLDGLGQGERLQAARFLGDVGYVVTFRQTDPLYVIDLSDPRHPRKAGELKVNGYSAYLHDAGGGRLIGVGADATDGGQRTGLQVSVFDVHNPNAPTRVANYTVPQAWSQAEVDPHAFLYWPKTGTIVLPATSPESPAEQAVVLRLSGNTLSQTSTLAHPGANGPMQRSMVIGDDLWTVSGNGMLVSALNGLQQRAWIPFS
ncbi:beta-propeller domain-containing protein [Labedaea rhizosphaerae]|uniref:Putative secreted protein with C-terminal beta-propeller domain n=1 Tax=Labedaea rhizosphaerae TaxID=598644 RepID=A0A4R6RY48_LABRH|nr:beta-propeller domain-containing protein [Labedaea rhizosphaerae]TDP92021.1 putative secreted protein with C-terminal beta-propeller domain [Labedaea rhizosphaerae]